MSEHVSFDNIPNSLRVPGQYIEFNTRNAVQGLPQNPQKMLLLAPMLTTGTKTANEPVQIFSDVQAGEWFGRGSWAQLMVRQAFLNNPYLDLTVLGLPDHEAGVAASARVELLGTVASTSSVELNIAGTPVNVAAVAGQTPTQVAEKLVNTINASDLPVSATNAQGVLTLTAKNKGEIGNEISIRFDAANSGLTPNVSEMAGGAKNVDIGKALSNIAGKHYHIIVSPFNDDANLRVLSEHVEQVSNAIEQRGCVAVIGHRHSMTSGAALTAKLNNGRMVCAWYAGAVESTAMIATAFAAVMAAEEDPARPLNTLMLKGLSITADKHFPLFNECQTALYNGLTPLTVVNNRVQIMRAVTTYTKNSQNVDDPSLLDVTTIRTLDYVRRAVKERIALRFPRDKLYKRMLPKVRSEILDVLLKLEQAEIIEGVAENKAKLIVTRSLFDANRVNAVIPADVVNGLHVFAGRIDLIL